MKIDGHTTFSAAALVYALACAVYIVRTSRRTQREVANAARRFAEHHQSKTANKAVTGN